MQRGDIVSYIYDLHVHSSECSLCAASDVIEQIDVCKDFGLSGFALTNHFLTGSTRVPKDIPWEDRVGRYWDTYLKGKEYGDSVDFDVLFGIEHHYRDAQEMLIYGIDLDFLLANPDFCDISPEEVCNRVHQAGGFVSHAHPFRERGYIPKNPRVVDMAYLDALEVYNGANREVEDVRAEKLRESLGLLATAGSDLHFTDHVGVIPTGGMEFPHRIKTSSQLVSALKSGVGRVWHKGDRYFK